MAWNELEGLFGVWVGEDETSMGAGLQGGMGEFSFKLQLDGAIVVRESFADYPASNGKPAFRHEDLMVVSHTQEGAMCAVYWDSEGHVIEYKVRTKTEQYEVEFVSDPDPRNPAFRLTYRLLGRDRIHGKFEIQPPGSATFSPYLEWNSTRKKC